MYRDIDRITQKDDQIYKILFYLCGKLLFAAEMTSKKFMNSEVGDLLYQSSGSTCSIQIVLGKDPPVCHTEILHELLF